MRRRQFYGAFVLKHRVVLHAIDATPARWRDDAGSSPLDGARRRQNVISFQVLHTGELSNQKKFENEICRHFLHRKAAAEAGFVLASNSNWMPQPRQRRVADDAGATA